MRLFVDLAPELSEKQPDLLRCVSFTLGCILHEMLTGSLPETKGVVKSTTLDELAITFLKEVNQIQFALF